MVDKGCPRQCPDLYCGQAGAEATRIEHLFIIGVNYRNVNGANLHRHPKSNEKERTMSPIRFLFPAVAVLMLSIPAVAQSAPAPNASAQAAPAQPMCGPGFGNGMMGFLTPEQRMMHFADMQKATADMSFNDMRSYRWNFRDKVMAMSAAERKKFADELTVKWNALSADEKNKIQQEFSAYRGTGRWGPGMGRGMGPGMGRGMGMGRGRNGCWW